MKKYNKKYQSFVDGFIFGINSEHHFDRDVQEQWNHQVLNEKESYEIFWSWKKGYSLGKKRY
jgi:hypothetical protein